MMLWLLAVLVWTTKVVSASELMLCVVTARRPTSYLPQLIAGLEREDADFMVVDVDNSTMPSVHAFRFGERTQQACRVGPVPCVVQRQALDVASALEVCASEHSTGRWVALVEDDMAVCPGAVEMMERVLPELGSFKTARFAKFSRAVVLPVENIEPYVDFVRQKVHMVPYDILLNFEWAEGQDYVHHESLFAHRGSVSTIEERNNLAYMATYSDLRGEECGSRLVGK
jgi:hypothetical protein